MSQSISIHQPQANLDYPETVRVDRTEDAVSRTLTILSPRVFSDIEAGQLNEAVREIGAEKHLILDMKEVDGISPQFLGMLIGASYRLQKTGMLLVLVGLKPEIEDVLKITRLDKLSPLRISGSIDEADALFD